MPKKITKKQGSVTYQEAAETIEWIDKTAFEMGLKREKDGVEVPNRSAFLNLIVDYIKDSKAEQERFIKSQDARNRKAFEI